MENVVIALLAYDKIYFPTKFQLKQDINGLLYFAALNICELDGLVSRL